VNSVISPGMFALTDASGKVAIELGDMQNEWVLLATMAGFYPPLVGDLADPEQVITVDTAVEGAVIPFEHVFEAPAGPKPVKTSFDGEAAGLRVQVTADGAYVKAYNVFNGMTFRERMPEPGLLDVYVVCGAAFEALQSEEPPATFDAYAIFEGVPSLDETVAVPAGEDSYVLVGNHATYGTRNLVSIKLSQAEPPPPPAEDTAQAGEDTAAAPDATQPSEDVVSPGPQGGDSGPADVPEEGGGGGGGSGGSSGCSSGPAGAQGLLLLMAAAALLRRRR
jgi:MYXO-CTERM domain-containing protein